MSNNNNDFRGYSLFNDVEDKVLQLRNRAVVMANIAEQYTKQKKINMKGASLILGYFDCIPLAEREELQDKFESTMKERGFVSA